MDGRLNITELYRDGQWPCGKHATDRETMGEIPEQDLTMLAATLQRLASNGQIDVQKAAAISGVDASAIYRWISGDRDPGFTNMHRVFLALPREAQAAILGVLSAGTPWLHTQVPAELDVNGDGDVDLYDVIDAVINVNEDATKELKLLRENMKAGQSATAAEYVELRECCEDGIHHFVAAMSVIDFLDQLSQRRRQARMTPAMKLHMKNGRSHARSV